MTTSQVSKSLLLKYVKLERWRHTGKMNLRRICEYRLVLPYQKFKCPLKRPKPSICKLRKGDPGRGGFGEHNTQTVMGAGLAMQERTSSTLAISDPREMWKDRDTNLKAAPHLQMGNTNWALWAANTLMSTYRERARGVLIVSKSPLSSLMCTVHINIFHTFSLASLMETEAFNEKAEPKLTNTQLYCLCTLLFPPALLPSPPP